MRYIMFVCVDPDGEKYVPEEDNVNEWVDEWAGARCEPSVTVSRA